MLEFNPPVIGHRGASGYAPENTMVSFTRAVQLGIQWVEFDVMLAKCGTPIIMHDETLERTALMQGNIGDYPFTFLHSLDVGSWFNPLFASERIPSLDHLAMFLAETGLKANVEIKPLSQQDELTVKNALQVIAKYFPLDSSSLLFSSFSLASLRYLRQYAPQCQLGLLMHEWNEDWLALVTELNCVSVHVNQEILTEDRAAVIKGAGKILLSYTVNEVTLAEKLFAMGVDAVFSDFPDKLMRFCA